MLKDKPPHDTSVSNSLPHLGKVQHKTVKSMWVAPDVEAKNKSVYYATDTDLTLFARQNLKNKRHFVR